nr:PREDICTED: CD177 antigen isoform X4 [Lepisosteus oculatus]
MKMLGILALTCALFPLATGLSCNQCLPTSLISTCTQSQVTCLPAFTQCFTGTLKATAAYTNTTPSGLKCYYCDGTVCKKTLTCQGVENRCFTASGSVNDQTQTYMGCASDNTCKAFKTDLSKILGQAFITTCCSGDLCNNAMRTGQSVFLLLVPLAFIKLFN